jgi:hypothetical protein
MKRNTIDLSSLQSLSKSQMLKVKGGVEPVGCSLKTCNKTGDDCGGDCKCGTSTTILFCDDCSSPTC